MKKTIAGVLILGATATGGTLAADRAIDPYTDKATHYELAIKSDIPQGERVEIHKDKAQMDLIGWNDEYKVSIIPQVPSTLLGAVDKPFNKPANRPLLSKKMEFKEGNVTAFIEPKDGTENEFDIDFTLDSKPDTNVFTYKIEGAEEFEFALQPPLNVEFNDPSCSPTDCRGDHRPENVVGSYAVFHKTKVNHQIGKTNYATGKVLHIYRPKAIDAKGAEMWAELAYIDGTLSVTVPQDFLNTAIYPVRVDPTFGYTALGATDTALTGDSAVSNFALSEDGDVTIISVGLMSGAASGEEFKGIIHDDDGTSGAPGTLTAVGAQADNTDTSTTCAGASFQDSTVTTSLTTGTWWLGVVVSADAEETCRDAEVGFTMKIDSTASIASPENPWTSAGETSLANTRFSVFATYTASGGGSPTPITPKVQIQAPIIINAPTILQ